MSHREEILEKVRSIPSLPAAASKVVQLLQDPEVSMDELMQTIELDPNLTTNVLRLANSAYFGGPRSVSSLREAIVRLGMNRILQMVMATAIAPIAGRPVRGYDLQAGELLRACVAVALGTEFLAEALNRRVPNYAFTAALLHDLGKIILGTFVEVDAEPILRLAYEDKLSFEKAERQILGIDHAETGAALLEHWNIPTCVVEVVRWHHDPDAFPGDTEVVDLVHLADHITISAGIGAGQDGLNYRPSESVLARVNLSTETAEIVVSKIITTMEGFESLFRVSSAA